VMLKVVLVLDCFNAELGGLESWTERLARWLLERGHAVSVVCFGGSVGTLPIDLHIVDGRGGPLARAAAVDRRLAQLSADIAHDTGTATGADIIQPQTGSRLVNLEFDVAGLPPWQRLRARLSPHTLRWRRELRQLERRQFCDPSRLIAVSQMVRDQIALCYGLNAAQIAVIHNAIETQRFAAGKLAALRAPARAKWALGDATTFVLVANNFHLKGVGAALHALARLRLPPARLRLLIAGSGDIPSYQRLARRLQISAQVVFAGRLGRVEEAYAAADVALQPTRYDACSLATVEGLASGLPTITTRRNGAAELLGHGTHGYILDDAEDVEGMAEAMQRLLQPELRQQMGRAARERGGEQDIEKSFPAIEAFYRQVLERRASRSRV
jgi:UDP-glucose:(heptosyl)LPS alpha-1,3-glucosyltransferase